MLTTKCCACRNFGNQPLVDPSFPPESFLQKSTNFTGDTSGGIGSGQFAFVDPSPVSLDPLNSFSLHCWVKPTFDAPIYATVIQTPDLGVDGVTTAYRLGLGGNTNLHESDDNAFRASFGIKDVTSEIVRFTSEPVVVPDIWTHIVAVWDDVGRTIKIYVNGISQTLYPGPPVAYDGGAVISGLIVGWNAAADTDYIWKGNICDIAFVEKQITDLESVSLNIRTVNLVDHSIGPDLESWWKLGDGDTHPTLKDSIGINNLTMVNMAQANIVPVIPFPNNPSPHRDTHRELNTDPLKLEIGGTSLPILYDHFMMASTGSLNIGSAGWGSDFSTDARQIRWYGGEAGHPGVIVLDNFGLVGAADEYASIMLGGPTGTGTIWNYVLDEPHLEAVNPNPGPLLMEFLIRFPKIATAELERGAFGFGDRFTIAAPLANPVHSNGFYIEFDPSIDSHFRLIATKTTGGVVTETVIGTTVVVANRWYKISAILRYEILTAAAVAYTPKMTLFVNDINEGSLTPVTALPSDAADLAFGIRAGFGTAPTGSTDSGNNYKNPSCPSCQIDYVLVTQISAGPTSV